MENNVNERLYKILNLLDEATYDLDGIAEEMLYEHNDEEASATLESVADDVRCAIEDAKAVTRTQNA